MVTKADALNGQPGIYEDVDSLLRRLNVYPAVGPAKLEHLAGKCSPGIGWV